MTTKEAFASTVSRETIERLDRFEDLLLKWNPRINLIAKNDAGRVWERHILDSTQVFDGAVPPFGTWFDFGSGGGFPGLICAILAAERSPETKFHLVESDTRKAVFLRQATSTLALNVTIHSQRIETFDGWAADVISARALAPLAELLQLSHPHIAPETQLLFPKGRKAETELTHAKESWRFEVDRIPSLTDPEATILRLTGVSPLS